MPVRKIIPTNRGTFFITFTCKDWLPLISLCNGYDLVYNWFGILKSKGHSINGFVIMPNHVHVMITFIESRSKINTIVGNGKRFMAYEMVKRLRKSNHLKLLNSLHDSVEPARKRNNKLHDVWKNSFDWKHCKSKRFKHQKLNYIHANPCSGKWNLATKPEDYLHSSAAFYKTGFNGVFPVDNIFSNVLDTTPFCPNV